MTPVPDVWPQPWLVEVKAPGAIPMPQTCFIAKLQYNRWVHLVSIKEAGFLEDPLPIAPPTPTPMVFARVTIYIEPSVEISYLGPVILGHSGPLKCLDGNTT